MNNVRTVITVDGLAGSGKTSLSKALAEALHYVHLSTGLVYRAVGLLSLEYKINPDNEKQVLDLVESHKIELRLVEQQKTKRSATVLIDAKDRGGDLYSPEVSEATSKCSRHAAVRTALFNVQRDAFPGENLVAEGRDMGTVVFSDALIKFFVEVTPETRVQRRIAQMYGDVSALNKKEHERIRQEMLKEITERDRRDSERTVAPTKASNDAIIINNSLKSFKEVLDEMVSLATAKITCRN